MYIHIAAIKTTINAMIKARLLAFQTIKQIRMIAYNFGSTAVRKLLRIMKLCK